MAIQRFYYNVFFQCHSLQPTKRTQRVMSANPQAGVSLVAEVRAMLASEFKRLPDEIEILQIVGVNDPSQVWPPAAAGEQVNQGEGARASTAVVGGAAGAGETDSSLPGWTPAEQPLVTLPTIEAASVYRKDQLIELAAVLKMDIGDPSQIKYPDLRKNVLGVLQQKLTGQTSAA